MRSKYILKNHSCSSEDIDTLRVPLRFVCVLRGYSEIIVENPDTKAYHLFTILRSLREVTKRGGGGLSLALPAFLLSAILFFLSKIREVGGPSPRSATGICDQTLLSRLGVPRSLSSQ